MHTIVVTGVSSGIGGAILTFSIENGVHVVGSFRRAKDEQRLKAEFPITAAAVVRERLRGNTLFGLITSTGGGPAGLIVHQAIDEIRSLFVANPMGPFL